MTAVRVFTRRAEGRPVGAEAARAQIAAQGWTWFVDYPDWAEPSFLWVCPDCGRGSMGTYGETPVSGWDAPRWVRTGEPDRLTLSPSLGCPNWRDGVCEGHWWLRDGVLTRA